MLVSVVITTFRNPHKFARALKSVTKQTHKDLEIIVVDGAHESTTEKIVNEFKDKRIKYIGLKNDTGPQNARNVGCKKSKGKYIAMLDDDDEWGPIKIERQLKEAKKTKADLVGCYAMVIFNEQGYPQSYGMQGAMEKPTYKDLLKGFNMSLTSSVFIKRDVLEKVGWWTDDMVYPEYDLALRVAKNGYIIRIIPELLFVFYKDYVHKRYANKAQTKVRITEFLNFWKYYGKEFIPNIGIKGFAYNVARTLGVLTVLFYGYVVGRNTTTFLDRLRR